MSEGLRVHLARAGQTLGPYTFSEVRQYLASGQVLPTAYGRTPRPGRTGGGGDRAVGRRSANDESRRCSEGYDFKDFRYDGRRWWTERQ